MLLIREYVHQLDWDDICKIHDKARILELEESAPKEAFIPLEECYKVEKLFDSIIFVAEPVIDCSETDLTGAVPVPV